MQLCSCVQVVLSPDLIRRIYRFQYNALENPCTLLKAIHAGVGFGSGTETSVQVGMSWWTSTLSIGNRSEGKVASKLHHHH